MGQGVHARRLPGAEPRRVCRYQHAREAFAFHVTCRVRLVSVHGVPLLSGGFVGGGGGGFMTTTYLAPPTPTVPW